MDFPGSVIDTFEIMKRDINEQVMTINEVKCKDGSTLRLIQKWDHVSIEGKNDQRNPKNN